MVANLFEHKHLLDYGFFVAIVIEFVVLIKKIHIVMSTISSLNMYKNSKKLEKKRN